MSIAQSLLFHREHCSLHDHPFIFFTLVVHCCVVYHKTSISGYEIQTLTSVIRFQAVSVITPFSFHPFKREGKDEKKEKRQSIEHSKEHSSSIFIQPKKIIANQFCDAQ